MPVNTILVEFVSSAEVKEFGMLSAEEENKSNATGSLFNEQWSLANTNNRKFVAEKCIFHFFCKADGHVDYVNSFFYLQEKAKLITRTWSC